MNVYDFIETHYYENWTTKLHEKNPIDKMKYNYITFHPEVCNLECS